MHESDSPPAPPRFRRSTSCELVMAHNDGVCDVSTVQTTPPFEVNLAAGVQKVHKMIADHIALATLASHRLFLLDDVPTIPGETGSIRTSLPTMSFTCILDDLRQGRRRIGAMLHRFLLRVVPRILLKPLFDGFADPLAQLSQIACPEDASTMLELSKNSPSLTNCVEHAHLRASTPPTAVGRTILRNNLAYVAISRSFTPQDSLPCPNTF